MIGKLGLAKSEAAGVFVQKLVPMLQADANRVQIPLFQVPQFDSSQTIQAQPVRDRFARGGGRRDALCGFGQHAITVEQFDFNRQWIVERLQMLEKTVNIHAGPGEYVLWLYKDVLDES